MTDHPSPSEILALLMRDAPDDAVGEWRVRVSVPRPPSFASSVEGALHGLAAVRDDTGQTTEARALAGLLSASLVRHTHQQCGCGPRVGVDPICFHAQVLADELSRG